jgi:ABC-2 type transport system permease protein
MPISERTPHSLVTQLIDILLIELTNWRWAWRSMVIVDTLAPLFSILGLGVFARDAGAQALAYVLTGNIVLALTFGTMQKVQNHVMFMRMGGMIEYFATLPVQRSSLVLAIMLAFLLLSVPSLLVTTLLGAWLLDVRLHIHPLVLLVVPVCALPLSGIGALIGAQARTPQEAGSFSLLLTLLFLALGPVLVPPERLPDYMLWLGNFTPATYAASAIRQVLIGPVTLQLGFDLTVLLFIAVATYWLVNRKIHWRQP